jgi:hypothetical protein
MLSQQVEKTVRDTEAFEPTRVEFMKAGFTEIGRLYLVDSVFLPPESVPFWRACNFSYLEYDRLDQAWVESYRERLRGKFHG